MARYDENQRDIAKDNYEKNNYTFRNGNLFVHYRKDANGRMTPVARPAFIKIK
jgi:alpha-amylase/alpha-mannosidase (GH57 family)